MYSKLYNSPTSTAAPDAAIIRGFEATKSKMAVSAAILPCADLHNSIRRVLQASKDFAIMQKAIY